MSLSNSLRFLHSSARQPCPICDDKTGDCKISDGEIILCHRFIDGGANHPDYDWFRESENGVWGVFAPSKKEMTPKERWEEKQKAIARAAQRKQELEAQAIEYGKGLSTEDRHKHLTLLSRTLGLNTEHRQSLRERGLTDDQITESLFFSVYPYQEIPNFVSDKLPGIDGNKLCSSVKGYGCPAFNAQGQAIGFQIRDENPRGNSKYKWAKGTFSSHLQNGELPLSVAGTLTDAVLLTEGILKPRIASYRLGGIRVVGASGGDFPGSPLQLRAAIGSCRRVIYCPDAGDVLNPFVVKRINRTLDLFNFRYKVEVAWWGQDTKDKLDIDERGGWDGVELLTKDQWLDLSKSFT